MRLFAGTPWDIPPTCDRCGREETECQCPPLPDNSATIPPEKQTLRVAVEKRKKGKVVTVVRGLADDANLRSELLTRLKDACGSGGTIRETTLEIQGAHAERVKRLLREAGFRLRG